MKVSRRETAASSLVFSGMSNDVIHRIAQVGSQGFAYQTLVESFLLVLRAFSLLLVDVAGSRSIPGAVFGSRGPGLRPDKRA